MTEKSYTDKNIRDCLKRLAVSKGDSLFIHSGLRGLGTFIPTMKSANKLDALLNIFLDVVGENGNLIVPTFNFDFCSGIPYDVQLTPSKGMGAFSEFIRVHPKAHRSHHPFHSVAAIGKHAVRIAHAGGISEFSTGSSFDHILQLNTKIIFFGVDFVETFAHIAEERASVPYRQWKSFSGEIITNGVSKIISVNFYARNFDMDPEPKINVDKIHNYLKNRGIITSLDLGAGKVSVCDSNQMVDELTFKFLNEPYFALA